MRKSFFALGLASFGLALIAGCAEDTCTDTGTCFAPVTNDGGGGAGGGEGGGNAEGGGGAAPECIEGTVQACYDGPAGTKNVGICKGGARSCEKGGVWGPCEGTVLPADERCDTPEDDDCDGTANQAEAGCVCEPASVQACYDGPMGTLGVGLCAEGSQTCEASGEAYGACMGAVLPVPEDCQNVADDDCDGLVCAPPLWAKLFASVDDDQIAALAADGTSVVIAGHTTGALDFGNGPLVSAGAEDVVVAKLGVDGLPLWTLQLGGAGSEKAYGVAIDGIGNILVTGEFGSQLDIGGITLTATGTTNTFVAKLGPDGTVQWANAFGVSGNTRPSGVAVDSFGRVMVAGTFDGQLYCGGVPIQLCYVSKGLEDGFVVAYNGGGAVLWRTTMGDAATQTINAVAADASGNVFITGKTAGTVDLSGPAASPPQGVTSAWLAKLNAIGDGAWVVAPGTSGTSEGRALAVDANGNVYVTGDVNGTIDLGALGQHTSVGLGDAFYATLSTAGTPLDGRLFGAPSQLTSGQGLALVGGGLALTGGTSGDVDFGGGVVPGVSANAANAFVVVLDATFAHRWSRLYGGSGVANGRAVALAPDGGLFFTAAVDGDVDAGLGPLVGLGGNDVLVARIGP